jgi:hypothetical protein
MAKLVKLAEMGRLEKQTVIKGPKEDRSIKFFDGNSVVEVAYAREIPNTGHYDYAVYNKKGKYIGYVRAMVGTHFYNVAGKEVAWDKPDGMALEPGVKDVAVRSRRTQILDDAQLGEKIDLTRAAVSLLNADAVYMQLREALKKLGDRVSISFTARITSIDLVTNEVHFTVERVGSTWDSKTGNQFSPDVARAVLDAIKLRVTEPIMRKIQGDPRVVEGKKPVLISLSITKNEEEKGRGYSGFLSATSTIITFEIKN